MLNRFLNSWRPSGWWTSWAVSVSVSVIVASRRSGSFSRVYCCVLAVITPWGRTVGCSTWWAFSTPGISLPNAFHMCLFTAETYLLSQGVPVRTPHLPLDSSTEGTLSLVDTKFQSLKMLETSPPL